MTPPLRCPISVRTSDLLYREVFESLFRALAVHVAPPLLGVKLRLPAFQLATFPDIKVEVSA